MSALAFELPAALEAHEPPGGARPRARRGRAAGRAPRTTARSSTPASPSCPRFLAPGDLLVVNISATLAGRGPGATPRRPSRARATSSTPAPELDDGWWVVELRTADGCRSARAPGRRAARAARRTRDARAAARRTPRARGLIARRASLAARSRSRTYLARHGRADPLRLRPRALAARGLPERLRDRARQRRDAERRPAVHAPS